MVVTVSNEYGAGAIAIAARVAGELGYECVDRQLPVVVAKRFGISPEEVEANEDTARTLGERWLTSLERATPELAVSSTVPPFDRALLEAVQDAVREYAARGNVVIVGRGAGVILKDAPGLLRVFLHAPREWRIAHVMAAFGTDRKTTEAEVERVDRMRAAYLSDWYGARFGDPANYDLCVDTSRFDESQCAAIIVTALRTCGTP
ncbi:MAG: cytidylate kinase-like family protein [Candidatus Tumulicola sp.]